MGKPKEKMGHATYEPYENLHSSVRSYDGGKCFTSHRSAYTQYDSCSYRWQAVKRAFGEDKNIYNSHSEPKKRLKGTGLRTRKPSTVAGYKKSKALVRIVKEYVPESGSLEGQDAMLVEAMAFRTTFAPYGNNAHHLLPDAELRHGIVEITEPAPQVKDVICQGLLKEKYNLNRWINMMILPTTEEDGYDIGLPTHPTKGEGYTQDQKFHTNYSAKVKDKVIRALEPYRDVVEAAAEGKKDHPNPDPKKIKRVIEDISETLHSEFVNNIGNIKAQKNQKGDITVDSLSTQVASWLGV